MNVLIPHDSLQPLKSCGAKTRAGTLCKRLPCTDRTRCHLHGGKSLAGHLHPRYTHGRYSKHTFAGRREEARRESRRRERARRREDRFVNTELDKWLVGKEWYDIGMAMRMTRHLRREYQARLAKLIEATTSTHQ